MKQRVKNALGAHIHNKGSRIIVNDQVYVHDTTREFYLFDVCPMSAPRMTRRDVIFTNPNHPDPKKRQREIVRRYFEYKNILKLQANLMQFKFPEVVEVIYFIPMPDTWSEKKKNAMNGMPHKQTPDTDNLTKAIKDSLLDQDSKVWYEKCEKRWAFRGSIIIFV